MRLPSHLRRPERTAIRAVLWTALACYVAIFYSNFLAAAQGKPDEYQIRAAFLYNFTKFVEWPPDGLGASSPFVIGILGEDPFGAVLDDIVRDKSWNGHRIVLKRLSAGGNFHGCQILYISNSERTEVPRILASLKGERVLTVGEFDRFLRQGGSVAFEIENDLVKIAINLRAAEANGMKLSSRLLAVARVVEGSRNGVRR